MAQQRKNFKSAGSALAEPAKRRSAISALQAGGCRLTKTRRFMIGLFEKPKPGGACCLLSAADIQRRLAAGKITANKTTVYRELAFLQAEGIIRAVLLRDGTKRYEILDSGGESDSHSGHQHLVCLNCHQVEEAPLNKRAAARTKAQAALRARNILKAKRFKVVSQPQEIFGLCRRCQ